MQPPPFTARRCRRRWCHNRRLCTVRKGLRTRHLMSFCRVESTELFVDDTINALSLPKGPSPLTCRRVVFIASSREANKMAAKFTDCTRRRVVYVTDWHERGKGGGRQLNVKIGDQIDCHRVLPFWELCSRMALHLEATDQIMAIMSPRLVFLQLHFSNFRKRLSSSSTDCPPTHRHPLWWFGPKGNGSRWAGEKKKGRGGSRGIGQCNVHTTNEREEIEWEGYKKKEKRRRSPPWLHTDNGAETRWARRRWWRRLV